ncbi:COX15/CtaA family protein [Noviherbaspirillum galbum]|uniref:Heme A synthase n=1 Tax=Noviherbaspirillum galbum TaxID=2709383 RepID=A0A6B3SUB9_9BURK|nr:COX15/CtaA family protein [Noviherbaspirillum galbum]NEX64317.1 heme A synthase [Noviherbaspirillum galbum]
MLTQLALTGLIVALLPLSVVWGSKDPDKYRKLAWVTVFLTFDLIMFGAFTRLTDSGLGCPDWPGCYGHANPLQAHEHISAAQAAMPGGPVSVAKAWIEMVHRYFAMAVGVLIISMIIIAVRGWLKSRRQDQRFSPRLPALLLAFVCLQGAFGAWTVTLKLQPVIVTIHLLLGMGLLGLLTWQAARQSIHPPVSAAATSLRLPAAICLAVLATQLALGGWVSTNYAALACMDFPLCHGSAMPDMDFANGFSLWRQLGKTAGGEYLPFPALTAIHWTHRCFAGVVLLAVGWTAHKALRVPGLQRTGRWLLAALALQLLTGISTVFLEWPLALAVMHNGGAALLLLLLVMLNFKAGIPAQAASQTASATHRVGQPAA